MRHLSAIDCNVFIGSILLDDTAVIEYAAADNRELYFGCNDKFYKTEAPGRTVVNGSITLNFRAVSYLSRAIMAADETRFSYLDLSPTARKRLDASSLALNYGLTEESEDAILEAIRKSLEQGPGQYDDLKTALKESSRDWFDKRDRKKYIQYGVSHMNKKRYEGIPDNPASTLEDLGDIDLIIQYDSKNYAASETTEILKDVHFLTMSKRIDGSRNDTTSAPVLERYEFVCKDVVPYVPSDDWWIKQSG